MDSKKQLEEFRVQQFYHGIQEKDIFDVKDLQFIEPDTTSLILHFDIDYFYGQVEEVNNPQYKGRPLGVMQKYLIVTCNYEARARNVKKLMSTKEAKENCPELILVAGEDLTPYRAAHKLIMGHLSNYGPTEKLGFDDMFVDATKEQISQELYGQKVENTEVLSQYKQYEQEEWYRKIMIGSQLAKEIRDTLYRQTGYKASCGVACNKLSSKLISGLHKPDNQTTILPPHVQQFVQSLPVRVISGVGMKVNQKLQQIGITNNYEMAQLPKHTLCQHFGEKLGIYLYWAARGKDNTPVLPKGPPKSITVEDSFKSLHTFKEVEVLLDVLIPDYLARLYEDFQDFNRQPQTLTIKYRFSSTGFRRTSCSCRFPTSIYPLDPAYQLHYVSTIKRCITNTLKPCLPVKYSLNLLNIGATNFQNRGANQIQQQQRLGAKTFQQGNDTLMDVLNQQKLELDTKQFHQNFDLSQLDDNHTQNSQLNQAGEALRNQGLYQAKDQGQSLLLQYKQQSISRNDISNELLEIYNQSLYGRRDYENAPRKGLLGKNMERLLREGKLDNEQLNKFLQDKNIVENNQALDPKLEGRVTQKDATLSGFFAKSKNLDVDQNMQAQQFDKISKELKLSESEKQEKELKKQFLKTNQQQPVQNVLQSKEQQNQTMEVQQKQKQQKTLHQFNPQKKTKLQQDKTDQQNFYKTKFQQDLGQLVEKGTPQNLQHQQSEQATKPQVNNVTDKFQQQRNWSQGTNSQLGASKQYDQKIQIENFKDQDGLNFRPNQSTTNIQSQLKNINENDKSKKSEDAILQFNTAELQQVNSQNGNSAVGLEKAKTMSTQQEYQSNQGLQDSEIKKLKKNKEIHQDNSQNQIQSKHNSDLSYQSKNEGLQFIDNQQLTQNYNIPDKKRIGQNISQDSQSRQLNGLQQSKPIASSKSEELLQTKLEKDLSIKITKNISPNQNLQIIEARNQPIAKQVSKSTLSLQDKQNNSINRSIPMDLLNKYFNTNGDLKQQFQLDQFLKSDYSGNYLEFNITPNQYFKTYYNRAKNCIRSQGEDSNAERQVARSLFQELEKGKQEGLYQNEDDVYQLMDAQQLKTKFAEQKEDWFFTRNAVRNIQRENHQWASYRKEQEQQNQSKNKKDIQDREKQLHSNQDFKANNYLNYVNKSNDGQIIQEDQLYGQVNQQFLNIELSPPQAQDLNNSQNQNAQNQNSPISNQDQNTDFRASCLDNKNNRKDYSNDNQQLASQSLLNTQKLFNQSLEQSQTSSLSSYYEPEYSVQVQRKSVMPNKRKRIMARISESTKVEHLSPRNKKEIRKSYLTQIKRPLTSSKLKQKPNRQDSQQGPLKQGSGSNIIQIGNAKQIQFQKINMKPSINSTFYKQFQQIIKSDLGKKVNLQGITFDFQPSFKAPNTLDSNDKLFKIQDVNEVQMEDPKYKLNRSTDNNKQLKQDFNQDLHKRPITNKENEVAFRDKIYFGNVDQDVYINSHSTNINARKEQKLIQYQNFDGDVDKYQSDNPLQNKTLIQKDGDSVQSTELQDLGNPNQYTNSSRNKKQLTVARQLFDTQDLLNTEVLDNKKKTENYADYSVRKPSQQTIKDEDLEELKDRDVQEQSEQSTQLLLNNDTTKTFSQQQSADSNVTVPDQDEISTYRMKLDSINLPLENFSNNNQQDDTFKTVTNQRISNKDKKILNQAITEIQHPENEIQQISKLKQNMFGNVTKSNSNKSLIIHVDVDCFYCQVERMDDPSLNDKPVVVHQFNSGGFVAVSYEARAKGIRSGDGVGEGGRRNISWLIEMGSRSIEECKKLCPGLIIKPMRTQRYREVGDEIFTLLEDITGSNLVEKSSYDDFYIDISEQFNKVKDINEYILSFLNQESIIHQLQKLKILDESMNEIVQASQLQESNDNPDNETNQLSQDLINYNEQFRSGKDGQKNLLDRFSKLAPSLQYATIQATRIKLILKEQMNFDLSCGVSVNKILARICGPMFKPDSLVTIHQSYEVQFIREQNLRNIWSLGGKLGREIQQKLQVQKVADLKPYMQQDMQDEKKQSNNIKVNEVLVQHIGQDLALFLSEIYQGIDKRPVQQRQAQKSISVGRSFPPVNDLKSLLPLLQDLAPQLLERTIKDMQKYNRQPNKLNLKWRQGYQSNQNKSKIQDLNQQTRHTLVQLNRQIQRGLGCSDFSEKIQSLFIQSAMNILGNVSYGDTKLQLTRLHFGFSYEDTQNQANSLQAQPNQLSSFFKKVQE